MDIKVTMSDQPGQQEGSSNLPKLPKDDAFGNFPVLYRWIAKIAIVILGALVVLMGVLTMFDLVFRCILAGIFLICLGIFVVAFEAPFLCTFCKFIEPLERLSAKCKPWMKIAIYGIPAVLIVILCHSISAIFGAIFMFMISGAYFVAFMSRKPHENQQRGFDDPAGQENPSRQSTPTY